jgi:hypothetical protein
MNDQVELAIRQAVDAQLQPREVANKIVAWMTELTSGNESITDSQVARNRVVAIYESVTYTVEGDL